MWSAWAMRLSWLSLPVTAGGVLADALAERSGPVGLVAAVLAWTAWGVVVLAVLLPRPLGLTALRLVAPAAFAAAVWAAADAAATDAAGYLLAALAGVPLVVAFLPEVGAWMVNGAAYGFERRYPLRAPGALLLGPILVAWLVVVAGVATGPLLLAAERWVAGAIVLPVGLGGAVVAARALHRLGARWVVLVPAGLVLKDHVTMLDPVLFRRPGIEVLRPAPAGSDSLDLTARAPGVALELRLREPENLLLVEPGRRAGRPGRSAMLLFTPTRPGALLADAATRRIPVA